MPAEAAVGIAALSPQLGVLEELAPCLLRLGSMLSRTAELPCQHAAPCSLAQVYISYGPVPNLKLLCYYGFVVPHNPHDLVPLLLEVRSSTSLYQPHQTVVCRSSIGGQ